MNCRLVFQIFSNQATSCKGLHLSVRYQISHSEHGFGTSIMVNGTTDGRTSCDVDPESKHLIPPDLQLGMEDANHDCIKLCGFHADCPAVLDAYYERFWMMLPPCATFEFDSQSLSQYMAKSAALNILSQVWQDRNLVVSYVINATKQLIGT